MKSRKPFLIFTALLLAVGASVVGYVWWDSFSTLSSPSFTARDRLGLLREHNPKLLEEFQRSQAQTVEAARVDPSRRIRLAVGSLGLPDEEQNRQAGDLVVAALSSARNLEMVDRQSLNAVLNEAAMSLSGLVRAQSAVRVGKLLRADWFLLGTSGNINGRQCLLARIVDARTGALRDLTALPNDGGPSGLASSVADFVRQSRHNASTGGKRTLLSIGSFVDHSQNAHQAGFGNQLRAHLLASLQGSTNVTILEREYVDLLLQEVWLDLAGMTDQRGTGTQERMLTALWMVDGDYVSSEEKGPEVELNLTLAQAFDHDSTAILRGPPDEAPSREPQRRSGVCSPRENGGGPERLERRALFDGTGVTGFPEG